jgi:hypothetical protein
LVSVGADSDDLIRAPWTLLAGLETESQICNGLLMHILARNFRFLSKSIWQVRDGAKGPGARHARIAYRPLARSHATSGGGGSCQCGTERLLPILRVRVGAPSVRDRQLAPVTQTLITTRTADGLYEQFGEIAVRSEACACLSRSLPCLSDRTGQSDC